MADRIAVHRDDSKPKYLGQDCDGCVFLGRYTYQAPFKNGPRKTTVDLYICLGQTDPSLIARFGSAPSKYSSHPIDSSIEEWLSSWRMKKDSEKPTYFDALREAWCRALALGLVKGKKGEGERIDWSDGNRLQLDLRVRARSRAELKGLIPIAKEYIDELTFGEGSPAWPSRALGSSAGSIAVSLEMAPGIELSSPSPPLPPFDPLTFLDAMAADAIQRAERLDLQAATGKKSPVFVTETREVAARYRLRAEAYKTAALEMRLEMEKRGMVNGSASCCNHQTQIDRIRVLMTEYGLGPLMPLDECVRVLMKSIDEYSSDRTSMRKRIAELEEMKKMGCQS